MKKQFKLRLIAVALLLCLTIPAVMAYMYLKTDKLDNQFEIANASCEVVEVYENNIKKSVKVENTGNIDAYVRLIIFTYWEDSKGNVVGRNDNPTMSFTYDDDKWIQDGNIYYCKTPVKVDEITPELFKDSSITLEHIVEYETTDKTTVTFEYNQVVEIIAEAIQSSPDDAVTSSWNVVLDSDGNIQSIK